MDIWLDDEGRLIAAPLAFLATPNKPLVAGTVSLRLTRTGKFVSHARVRVTFTMLDMDMTASQGSFHRPAPAATATPDPCSA